MIPHLIIVYYKSIMILKPTYYYIKVPIFKQIKIELSQTSLFIHCKKCNAWCTITVAL